MPEPTIILRGFHIFKGLLDSAAQVVLLDELRDVVAQAPLFSPGTPYGKPMSVKMTSAGKYGWYSDRSGYRYVPLHPNGAPWPAIPAQALALWRGLVSTYRDPDCCLINLYDEGAHMGMHRDCDETDFNWPVLSVSLGNDGLFRVGNTTRGGKTSAIWLNSGDVVVMDNEARLAYHGVDRIRFSVSKLMPKGGRINLTMRVVD